MNITFEPEIDPERTKSDIQSQSLLATTEFSEARHRLMLECGYAPALDKAARAVQNSTERAKYEISFTWIRTALQYAAELLKGVAVLLTILYFLGAVAICIAILFYTFCR
jgi:hypothetical protein